MNPARFVVVAMAALLLHGHVYSQKPLSRKELIKKYDKDGDGKLNEKERAAFRADLKKGVIKPAANVRLPNNIVAERDVEYGLAGKRSLKLDIYYPKEANSKALPAIVWIHGGGWRAGNKSGGIRRLLPFLRSGHYVGVSVGYRLSGEAKWPAQIHDCKAAIRWLRAHAGKYHIDTKRIGVWGSSAGGHLVSLLGTSGGVKELEGDNGSPDRSSQVTCVVDFCGPSDFLAFAKQSERIASPKSAVSLLFGGTVKEKSKEAKLASPVTHVTSDDPPFLIVHGTNDKTVPMAQAEGFYQSLKKVGVDATFVKMEGGGHGIGGAEIEKRVAAFFGKHLLGKDGKVSGEPIKVGSK